MLAVIIIFFLIKLQMQTCKVKVSSTMWDLSLKYKYLIVPTQNFGQYCYKSQPDKHIQH